MRRRRYSSPSEPAEETHTSGSTDASTKQLERAGQILRDARKRHGFTLTEVEERTGLHASSISRFERGRDARRLSRVSLEALADALRLDGRERLELFRPFGLPPATERELAVSEFAGAFDGAQLSEGTRAALRQRHLANVAERYLLLPTPRVGPIDPSAVLRAHGLQIHEAPGQRPWVRVADDVRFDATGARQRRRFLLAHAAAHHALAQEGEYDALRCALPDVDELDLSANALSWLILVPGDRLRDRALAAGAEVTPWEGDGGLRIIVEVAEHFDVPVPAAAKRMAEEGLIAEMWGLNEP
jgi:transcriptional regulator with XRE-family HTH domain